MQAARQAEEEREAQLRKEYISALPDEINMSIERAVQSEVRKMRAEVTAAHEAQLAALQAQLEAKR